MFPTTTPLIAISHLLHPALKPVDLLRAVAELGDDWPDIERLRARGVQFSQGGGDMNSGADERKGPLGGIRVIDWTVFEFGPVSTMMLADLGAEVIKVESLDGDPRRQFHRVSSIASELPQGLNGYFEGQNRQKLGIALDLKNPKGVEIMYKLVEKSDVFVETTSGLVP
jgi:hypothetical protein